MVNVYNVTAGLGRGARFGLAHVHELRFTGRKRCNVCTDYLLPLLPVSRGLGVGGWVSQLMTNQTKAPIGEQLLSTCGWNCNV
jgi:hypothetical protein